MNRLENKKAIVTGAASGIGKAISEHFIKEGARVILADLNIEAAEKIASSLGENAFAFEVDVTKSNQVMALITFAEKMWNGLDIFVNNAGVGAASKTADTSEEVWQKVIDTNLKGTFLGMKYAIPAMQKNNGGSIINISSIAALVGLPERAVYSAAKGGILSLTRAAAIDHASEKIRINCIAPGTVDTPWITRITNEYENPQEAKKAMEARQPHGRLVSPEEIAAMAVYLASDEAASTIGAVMVIDGGATAR